MDGLGAAAPNVEDHKQLEHASKEGEVFDASQYAFFGKDVAEEVNLAGLEDEDDYKAMLAVEFNEEDFCLTKEEVIFQSYAISSKFQNFLWLLCVNV
ncbi:protein PAT1 homolog [Cajanus cajan]|uniref:protein PAT1 homolog n=1 Tax=Cajanus cajan TaxID=3821 RepID=UPI0010FB9AC9|nr:protein PAT1 homolog [Cajanus cajan]